MRNALLIACLLLPALSGLAQERSTWSPYVQQTGLNYSSDHVTSAGIGLGVGIALRKGDHFLAQTDVNIHWLNGNAVSTRLSAGYARKGVWAPAVLGNIAVLLGSRTEVLLEDGRRPLTPVAVFGLRMAALRFQNEKGFVSALETSFGVGPYDGRCVEVSFLVIAIDL